MIVRTLPWGASNRSWSTVGVFVPLVLQYGNEGQSVQWF